MSHIFVTQDYSAVSIEDSVLEQVLGKAMKLTFGFKSPTKRFRTWSNRLESLMTADYTAVIKTLIRLGYGL